VHPGLFFAQSGQESEPEGAGKFDWNPDKSPSGPVSVIVSSADKTVYVYRNGMEIGRAGIPNVQVVSSESLFLAAQKSGLSTEFLTKAKAVITPGATIILTDKPVDPTTQSPTGFQIIVAQKDKPATKVG
jgi:hypothetical protein